MEEKVMKENGDLGEVKEKEKRYTGMEICMKEILNKENLQERGKMFSLKQQDKMEEEFMKGI
jgi:hypothetical protein